MFTKWKDDLASNGLKVHLGQSQEMVSGDNTKGCLSISKVYQCEVCCLKGKANSFWCLIRG